MSRKKEKKRGFRRAENASMTRDQAKLINKKERLTILKRRRRLLIALMAAGAGAIALVVVFLTGGFEKKALTVRTDGSIVFEELDAADSTMTAGEVKAYAKEAIRTYNEKKGAGRVSFKKCEVADGLVYLKTTYQDAATYADFTGLEFFHGTVGEAKEAGYDFNSLFVSVKDGKKSGTAKASDVREEEQRHVVILDQAVTVALPSDAVCLSDEATSIKTAREIRISDMVQTYLIY